MFESKGMAREKKIANRYWFAGEIAKLIKVPKGGHCFLMPALFRGQGYEAELNSEPFIYDNFRIAAPKEQVCIDGSIFTQADQKENLYPNKNFKIGDEYPHIFWQNRSIHGGHTHVYGRWSKIVADKKYNPYVMVYDGMNSPVREREEVMATINRANELPHDVCLAFNILALNNGRGSGALKGTVLEEFKKFPEFRKALVETADYKWEVVCADHNTTTRQGHPMRAFILFKHEKMTAKKAKLEATMRAWVTIRAKKLDK